MSPSLTAPSSAHEKNVFSQRWPFWEYIEVALKEVPADSTDEWKDGIANYKISQLRTEAEQYFSEEELTPLRRTMQVRMARGTYRPAMC